MDLISIPETNMVEGEDQLQPLSSDLPAQCAHAQTTATIKKKRSDSVESLGWLDEEPDHSVPSFT